MRSNLFQPAYLLGAVLVIAGLVLAYQFVEPAPPDRLVMATGPEGGVYEAYARNYRELLAERGVTLELRESAGSVRNVELLRADEGGVDLAFVQGGIGSEAGGEVGGEQPVALGTVFREPLWIVTRLDPVPRRLSELRGRRLAVGPEGSGTRALAVRLLEVSGARDATLSPLTGRAAVDALGRGEVDVVFAVSRVSGRAVTDLIAVPGARLVDLAHAPGFAQVFPYLEAATLHEGVLDFAADRPPAPVRLVAPTASLVARRDLHPALVDLILTVARTAHADGDILSPVGRYPSPDGVSFPLADQAQRFYDRGPPFLQRWLPFWLATFVDRTAVMLIPLLTLLLPLARILPPLVQWRMQTRVFRWYARLADVERAVAEGRPEQVAAARHDLEQVDEEVRRIKVPMAYNHLAWQLRAHIALVRQRLDGAQAGSPKAGA